jgi:prepilin-type N-terminal cleavage/methylation domain-containing protein
MAKPKFMSSGRAGFSILEVIISLAILTILLLGLGMMMQSSQDVYTAGMNAASVQNSVALIVDGITMAIKEGRIVSVSSDGRTITLQCPVDWDGDNDCLSNSWAVEWGAKHVSGENRDWSVAYSFQPDTTVSESGSGIDYNCDGDTADTFRKGAMYRWYLDSSGAVNDNQVITPSCLLQPVNYGDGDVNNDASNDPVFIRLSATTGLPDAAGSVVRVSFFMVSLDGKNRATLRQLATAASTRN